MMGNGIHDNGTLTVCKQPLTLAAVKKHKHFLKLRGILQTYVHKKLRPKSNAQNKRVFTRENLPALDPEIQ